MDNNSKYLKRVAGTLRYGWFDGAHFVLNWAIVIVICIVFLCGLVLILIYSILDYLNGIIGIAIFLVYIVAEVIGFLCVPALLLYILIKNSQHRKKIIKWLCDAVELNAYAKKIGEVHPPLSPPIYKIQIEFMFNGGRHSFESICNHIGGGVPCGYQRIWKDFLDKHIQILYSPNFNEVMILKQ